MNPVTHIPSDLAERLAEYAREKQHKLDSRIMLDTDQVVQAAVLVPLIFKEGEWHLLFEHRTEKVGTHKDEVSFPGGAFEAADSSPEATALREAEEEIGLLPQNVHIIGRLPVMKMFPFFQVTPVVAWLEPNSSFCLSQDEVSRTFTIPLSWLGQPENWHNQPILHDGVEVPVLHYYPYKGEVVWGATAYLARMLAGLIY
ncbi:MAG: CoA pyrophosphatase [Anaerolineaceae bacterium]|nr:CoA pyrophosphatase [Anaerolineaceae bacterium]